MNGLEMEIKPEDLNFIRHIATSRMARVDLCQWSSNGVKKTVAKKSLVTGDTLRFKKELSSEIAILLAMKHESIIEILGYIHSDAEFGLVMRYYKFGSYHKAFIETNYENPRTEEDHEKLLPLKLRIMEEISSAMQYLHSARPKFVLHLDIKAENVLMDDDLHAKIADFGLSEAKTVSRLSNQSSCANTGETTKGTLFYISPEHLNDPRCKPTTKADVYAFGILAWQIFTDSNPYEDICDNNASLVIHHVQTTGCRPSLELVPACTPAALIKTVIEESWNSDPEKRPIFAEILERTQQEILSVENFQRGVAEAVESAKRMLSVPTDVSMPEEGATVVGSASSSTPISWEIVSNGIQRRGGLSRLNYGEFPIMATTELHLRGIKVVWSCKAMCVKTGNSTKITDKASPFGACELAVCRLIKDMIAKGIYRRPIDEDKMRY